AQDAASDGVGPKASDSTAELTVQIAKQLQARAQDDFRLGMNTVLDYVRDLVEPRAAAGDREGQIVGSLGAAAEYRAESIEIAKENLEAALDYSRAFIHARTAAELGRMTNAHAGKE